MKVQLIIAALCAVLILGASAHRPIGNLRHSSDKLVDGERDAESPISVSPKAVNDNVPRAGKFGEHFKEHSKSGGKYEHIQKFLKQFDAERSSVQPQDGTVVPHDEEHQRSGEDTAVAHDHDAEPHHEHPGHHEPHHKQHGGIGLRLKHFVHRAMHAVGLGKPRSSRVLAEHSRHEHKSHDEAAEDRVPPPPPGHETQPPPPPADAPGVPPPPPMAQDHEADYADDEEDAKYFASDAEADHDDDDEDDDEERRHGFRHGHKHGRDHHHRHHHHDDGIGGVIALILIITAVVLVIRRCRRRRRAWNDMTAAVHQLQREVAHLRQVTGASAVPAQAPAQAQLPAGMMYGPAAPQQARPQPQPQQRYVQPQHPAMYPHAQTRAGYANNEEREDAPLIQLHGHSTS